MGADELELFALLGVLDAEDFSLLARFVLGAGVLDVGDMVFDGWDCWFGAGLAGATLTLRAGELEG